MMGYFLSLGFERYRKLPSGKGKMCPYEIIRFNRYWKTIDCKPPENNKIREETGERE